MNDLPTPDPPEEHDEPISVEIEALRGLLQEVADNPQSRFHERLAARDGAEWFERCVGGALAALGFPGAVLDPRDRDLLLELKRAGKRQLRKGATIPEKAEAVALYFGAVVLLLAHPETTDAETVSGLSVRVLEHTIGELRDVLDARWTDTLDRAEQTLG